MISPLVLLGETYYNPCEEPHSLLVLLGFSNHEQSLANDKYKIQSGCDQIIALTAEENFL